MCVVGWNNRISNLLRGDTEEASWVGWCRHASTCMSLPCARPVCHTLAGWPCRNMPWVGYEEFIHLVLESHLQDAKCTHGVRHFKENYHQLLACFARKREEGRQAGFSTHLGYLSFPNDFDNRNAFLIFTYYRETTAELEAGWHRWQKAHQFPVTNNLELSRGREDC